MEGWIKLHRRVTESGFWTDSYAVHLWVHLLINATYFPKKTLFNGKIVELKEGQLITGRKKLSYETGISEQIIRKWLELFEINQQITIEKTNAGSCISIINFKNYQQDNQQTIPKKTKDQPTTNQQQTSDQPLLKEIEEGKEIEEIKKDEWDEIIDEFYAYRKQMKKPLKEISRSATKQSLKENSGENLDVARKMLQQTISWGYQGIFPLKNNTQLTPTSKPVMKNGKFGKL
jgi:hypothetical protein